MTEDRITDAEAWLELREGETATVVGKLGGVAFNNGHIVVRFADWTEMLIDTPDRGARHLFEERPGWELASNRNLPRLAQRIKANSYVHVRVERTEDGLRGLAIWTQGGVPIPLTDHAPA